MCSSDLKPAPGSCDSWRNGLQYRITENGLLATAEFTGTYPTECGEKVFPLSVFSQDAYAETMFRWIWSATGGRFVGQVTVNNVVRGSAQFASVGYWIDKDAAGRGVMPRAVALVIDHCLTTARLHRIEIAIRPENSNSLRVVEKLGIAEVGYADRKSTRLNSSH